MQCPTCGGKGTRAGYGCPDCSGTGDISDVLGESATPEDDKMIACPTCEGKGNRAGYACVDCNGTGKVEAKNVMAQGVVGFQCPADMLKRIRIACRCGERFVLLIPEPLMAGANVHVCPKCRR